MHFKKTSYQFTQFRSSFMYRKKQKQYGRVSALPKAPLYTIWFHEEKQKQNNNFLHNLADLSTSNILLIILCLSRRKENGFRLKYRFHKNPISLQSKSKYPKMSKLNIHAKKIQTLSRKPKFKYPWISKPHIHAKNPIFKQKTRIQVPKNVKTPYPCPKKSKLQAENLKFKNP